MDPLYPCCALWKFSGAQDRHLWIWIYPWISTQKSVDMDMDMDGKFHIHGKPGYRGHVPPPLPPDPPSSTPMHIVQYSY